MLLDALPERIRWFKSQGCAVSFTTNGTVMTKRQAYELLSSGLDSLTFSMAGASPEVHDSLRGQGTHTKLWQTMRLVRKTILQQPDNTPSLAVSYLLTPETTKELPQAVKQCRPLGLSLFAGVHMTHAATMRQKEMVIYSSRKQKDVQKIIRRAGWHAFLGRMRLQMPSLQSELAPVCDKNPLAGCFIAADGSVAPCVFLHPPVIGQQNRWFTENGEQTMVKKRLGNLNEDSLDRIWQSKPFQTFRKSFQRRLDVYEREMAKVGLNMDAIERLEQAKDRIRKAFESRPVPEWCSGCPKMKGF